MSDNEYFFIVPFWILLAIIALGFWLQIPLLVGVAFPFFVLVVSTKL